MRIQYTEELIDRCTPIFKQGLRYIYTLAKQKTDLKKHLLRTFQEHLQGIPKWNSMIIMKEFDRFKINSNCLWLDKLIKASFVAEFKNSNKHLKASEISQIKLDIPKSPDFIHICYIEIARTLWSRPQLIFDGYQNEVRKQHDEELSAIIKSKIIKVIKDMLPLEDMITNFLKVEEEIYNSDNDEKSSIRGFDQSEKEYSSSDSDVDGESDVDEESEEEEGSLETGSADTSSDQEVEEQKHDDLSIRKLHSDDTELTDVRFFRPRDNISATGEHPYRYPDAQGVDEVEGIQDQVATEEQINEVGDNIKHDDSTRTVDDIVASVESQVQMETVPQASINESFETGTPVDKLELTLDKVQESPVIEVESPTEEIQDETTKLEDIDTLVISNDGTLDKIVEQNQLELKKQEDRLSTKNTDAELETREETIQDEKLKSETTEDVKRIQHVVNDLREYVNINDVKTSNEKLGMPILMEKPIEIPTVDQSDALKNDDIVIESDQKITGDLKNNIKVIHMKEKKNDKIKSLLGKDVTVEDLQKNKQKIRRSLLKDTIGF